MGFYRLAGARSSDVVARFGNLCAAGSHTAPLAQHLTPKVQLANASDLDDADLMQEVADNSPVMKSQYEENLRRVNESIRDAQGVVDESPNDEDARRSLMDAYQQKSMLFELAMDRSQP